MIVLLALYACKKDERRIEGAVNNALSDDLNKYWHSKPFDSENKMPQWFTVDMQKDLEISGFIYANPDNALSADACPKRIRFDVSPDGATWTTALVVDKVPRITGRQKFPCQEPVTARYFRLTVETNWADCDWTYVAYISIY